MGLEDTISRWANFVKSYCKFNRRRGKTDDVEAAKTLIFGNRANSKCDLRGEYLIWRPLLKPSSELLGAMEVTTDVESEKR